MKTRIHHLALAALAVALLGAPLAKAGSTFDFQVNLYTTGLTGAANSPFYLDFQLNEGSGTLPNSVTLSNFSFDNGSATGSASIFGTGTGDLMSSITLSASSSSVFNELYQGFANGTTGIHFDVSITQNSPGSEPDGFHVAILDSESGLPQLATNAPDGVSLVSLNIGSANTLSDIGFYSSTSPAVTATAVPEPATTAAGLGAAALALVGFLRSRKRATA